MKENLGSPLNLMIYLLEYETLCNVREWPRELIKDLIITIGIAVRREFLKMRWLSLHVVREETSVNLITGVKYTSEKSVDLRMSCRFWRGTLAKDAVRALHTVMKPCAR